MDENEPVIIAQGGYIQKRSLVWLERKQKAQPAL